MPSPKPHGEISVALTYKPIYMGFNWVPRLVKELEGLHSPSSAVGLFDLPCTPQLKACEQPSSGDDTK